MNRQLHTGNFQLSTFNFPLPNRLRASTMVELLVVMIVSGILFLSVMEGLSLFRNYALSTSGRIAGMGRFYGNFYRLRELVEESDSVVIMDDAAQIYRAGERRMILIRNDTMLIGLLTPTTGNDLFVDDAPKPDTLLWNVAEFYTIPNRRRALRADTVKLILNTTGDGPVTVAFPTARVPREESEDKLEEIEKKYSYE